jgi:hypothetical protein
MSRGGCSTRRMSQLSQTCQLSVLEWPSTVHGCETSSLIIWQVATCSDCGWKPEVAFARWWGGFNIRPMLRFPGSEHKKRNATWIGEQTGNSTGPIPVPETGPTFAARCARWFVIGQLIIFPSRAFNALSSTRIRLPRRNKPDNSRKKEGKTQIDSAPSPASHDTCAHKLIQAAFADSAVHSGRASPSMAPAHQLCDHNRRPAA